MLKQRLLVISILLPLGLFMIVLGGIPFDLFISLFLVIAAWEYTQMMEKGGYQPARRLVVIGTLGLTLSRSFLKFNHADLVLSVIIITAITLHLFAYEHGRDLAGTDFAVTLGGILYIGWIGAYLVSLRQLPDGLWWFMVVLPASWLADAGAYFIGRYFGRHHLSPRISPKKTWEGYWGGVVAGTLGTAGLTLLWQTWGSPVELWQGAVVGVVISVITPLGDLAESVFKRQVGVKDSGNMLPGHGGFFDRIDSWLWAGVIGYYLVNSLR